MTRRADPAAEQRVGDLPLLRVPPFPGARVMTSQRALDAAALGPDAMERLLRAIRNARVGGRFWAPPVRSSNHRMIVRLRSAAEVEPLLATLHDAERRAALWILPAGGAQPDAIEALVRPGTLLLGDPDPWSVLDEGTQLLAHGDDEWAAIGHIAGRDVRLLSAGRFGEAGNDAASLRCRISRSLSQTRYVSPFTGQDTDAESIVALLADWRRTIEQNHGIVAACGFAWWKRREIRRFLWTPAHPLRFFRSERHAIDHARRRGAAVAIWPSRVSAGMPARAEQASVPLIRVEDGFVRSVGLGANLVPPFSVAVDRLGIHYDPSRPSDLEAILAGAAFPPELLARAARLRRVILESRVSKYGGDDDHAFPPRQPGRRLALVPGQVEDDMSVRLGGHGLSSNLELLRRARKLEPDAEIWFRPHPDVDAGHRRGAIRDEDALEHADRVVRGGSMARLLEQVDAVHVLTSLTGFEALLRDREVTCHGTPFYAGWSLTRDLAPVPTRRARRLTLEELIAAVLILYPRYLDPVTELPCPPEVLIDRMVDGAEHNRLNWVTRIRKLQGRLLKGLP